MDMVEIRSVVEVRGNIVNVVARRYQSDDRVSFAAEFEIEGRVTNSVVRSVLCIALGTIGSVSSMRDEIDSDFMSEVRSSDHVVVDIPSATGYAGTFMAKSDGMKVYAFCYEFGYVIRVTDPMLTVVACMVTIVHRGLPEITRPDVLLLEMMVDGSMVYIDTLAVNSDGKLAPSMDNFRCPIETVLDLPHILGQDVDFDPARA